MFQPHKPATWAILPLAPDLGGRSNDGSPEFIWDPLDPRGSPELGPAVLASQARLKLRETPLGLAARQKCPSRAGEPRNPGDRAAGAGGGVRAAGAQERVSLRTTPPLLLSGPFRWATFHFIIIFFSNRC